MKNFFKPESLIATFFGVGKSPIMPGTCGSLIAMLIVVFLFYQPHYVVREGQNYLELGSGIISKQYIIYVLILMALFAYVFGVWASEKYSKSREMEDPGEIVIDEVAGIWTAFSLIALIYAGLVTFLGEVYILYLMLAPTYFLMVFVLFRIFDMAKPWHVGIVEKRHKGGFGIMIDDMVAGVYSAIAFYIILFVLKFTGILDILIEPDNLEMIINFTGRIFEILFYIPGKIYELFL